MAPRIKDKYRAAKAYFLATEAVSRPIAFLMAFFSMALLASISTGIFLLGRWGYRQVINVEEPAAVIVPESNNTTSENSSDNTDNKPPADTTQPKPSTTQASAANDSNLPNTGSTPGVYVGVALLGASAHHIVTRRKLSRR